MIPSFRAVPALLATLAGLAGCASFSNIASPAKVPAQAFTSTTSGVIVMSLGAPTHCITVATYVMVMEARTGKMFPSTPMLPIDFYTNKSEFADHHGLVNALVLPAGDYYLNPYVANGAFTLVHKPRFDFHVNAGETVYLGELFMPVACGGHELYEVHDQYDRDVPMAIAANPVIAEHPPVKRLMQGRQR